MIYENRDWERIEGVARVWFFVVYGDEAGVYTG